MSRPMPTPDQLRDPADVLAQIRKGRFVDVLNMRLEPDHIHHKHFWNIAAGEREGIHLIQVQTAISFYLLPVQFDTEEAANAYLNEVAAAYRSKK